MNKYRVGVICCVLGLMVSGAAYGYNALSDPSLIGYWEFNEGEGTTVSDSSGNGHDGTFLGSPVWVPGIYEGALSFIDGDSLVEIPSIDMSLSEATIAGWVKPNGSQPDWSAILFMRGSASGFNVNGLQLMYHWADAGNSYGFATGITLADGEWNFATMTIEPTQATFYLNGVEGAANVVSHGTVNWNANVIMAGDVTYTAVGSRKFTDAALDDVSFFSRALSADDIVDLMSGLSDPVLAGSPSPADEHPDVLRDSILTWSPGMFSGTHNVYFGTDLDEITNATVPTSADQSANSYDPGRLEFGQTYYWRVDEVNSTPDKTVHAGDVWSFTAEPYSIAIPGADIVVTASSNSNEFSTADKAIDGSGLGADDTHSIGPDTMWFSASPDMDPWIQFDFDGVKKLDTMKVWNSNGAAEAAIGWGVKDVEIAYSTDGETWTVLEGAAQFGRAPGNPAYNAFDEVDFGGAAAKMVRLNIASNWGGLLMSYSLSEVQFAAIPASARTPEPASGSTEIVPNATVAWRAGREAAEHTIYVSTDANAVADGSAPSAISTTNSLDLTPFDLDMGTAYYWRVDEVNQAEATSVWAGPVWSLSTAAALIVDDFESYGNLSPNRPFQTWLDGFGYSADEFFTVTYGGNGTGAGIGHDIWSVSSPHYNGDIMEKTATLPGSGQSMPFYYGNSGGTASHTDRTFASAQDWTVGSAQTLSIAFRGQSGNTGTLYVEINGVKITYPHDSANIGRAVWQAWNIDLASVNTNLQSVTTLTIGVDGSNASGMVLIDDITLHAAPGEIITPVEPGNANLVLHYTFDEGSGASIGDSSGNGYSGTFESIPAWATGVTGSAISLDGVGSYVNAPAAAWSSIDTEFTVSFYTMGDAGLGNNWAFYAGDAAGRIASCHLPWGTQAIFDSTVDWNAERVIVDAVGDELRGQWRQWTIVRNSATGVKQVYMDGVLYGSTTATAEPVTGIDRFFIGAGDAAVSPYMGLIDDFQIYNRALSAEEVLWNAGVTTPIDKPF